MLSIQAVHGLVCVHLVCFTVNFTMFGNNYLEMQTCSLHVYNKIFQTSGSFKDELQVKFGLIRFGGSKDMLI